MRKIKYDNYKNNVFSILYDYVWKAPPHKLATCSSTRKQIHLTKCLFWPLVGILTLMPGGYLAMPRAVNFVAISNA